MIIKSKPTGIWLIVLSKDMKLVNGFGNTAIGMLEMRRDKVTTQ